jgi:formate hydrogenlyase subunit 6/NADH:ubiquinone oxidoreductase subunit I
MWLLPYHQLDHSRSLDPSNYRVKTDPSTCKSCGLCVKRCPMDALTLKTTTSAPNKYRKAAVLDLDKCIGCGVCVHKCPTDCLTLVEREERDRPPKNPREWGISHFKDLGAAAEKKKKGETPD